ncbi:hypothetical protein T06_2150, partial [Trichinella sp. T6]
MEARTCTTMILLFNINCHYERCKLHIDNVVHMTSPSVFTCQISKKGIHYSSIQGHLLNSHTSPSPVKLNRVKMNRNSLGLNLKLLMCFIAKIEKALRLQLSVAWGVACGYLFKNLEIFWNLRKFCLRHSLGRSQRVNIYLKLPEA